MRLTVIGIGNPWASDDGVGPKAIEQLEAACIAGYPDSTTQVAFITARHADIGLLDVLASSERVILVDALFSGAPPGTIYCEEWQPDLLNSRGIERASSHGMGVKELLELAAALGKLPGQVQLWGIEVESTEPGNVLSPKIGSALPVLIEQLGRAVEDALYNLGRRV
jgi:hydrogenase maturation protease